MMTEAEALKTLAREDPAVADDARTALRSLTSGGGLGAISLLRLQEFLWYGLPTTAPQATDAYLAVAKALARLFTLADMERYAEVCASEETAQIIAAYGGSRAEGVAAYDACAGAIELAIACRELKVGVSGWKTKRALLVERWLTRTDSAPGMDTWLSRISAERIEEWAHGHPGERSRLARNVMPRLLEPPDLPDEPLPTLAWLLGHASIGLRLTARHYIAPSLVGEAAELFSWGPSVAAASTRRHQELDVYPLHTLRGMAQHEMGAVRRSGSALVLTRTGRLMAEDAAVRWHIGTASLIGSDDGPDPDFTVAV